MPPEFAIMTARPALRARASYDGAAQTRRTRGWVAPSTSPNSAMLGGLSTLRDRSRQAVRNDGFAKSALNKLTTNIIGTGIKPLSQSADLEFRKAVHELWLRWTDESDADGLLDFYGQQTQATHTWLEAGECFVRFRDRLSEDGLSVPMQVQVLEPELCPYTQNSPTAETPKGHKVRAGIEFNRIGKRTAYYFHPVRPGEPEDFDANTLIRVPADRVVHLYDPLRPGQLRGLPHLSQALIELYEISKLKDAYLLRQQLANMFVGFLKRAPTNETPQTDPLTNLPVTTDAQDRAPLVLESGTFQEMGPDEELEWSKPPDPSQSYPDFIKSQLRAVAVAVDVPYEVLTGDMRDVNDRTVRAILQEFRRRIQAWQHQIIAFQLCRPLFRAWMDRAVLSGALDLPVVAYFGNRAEWGTVRWIPQAWPYLNPVQDIEAKTKGIRAGLTSRSAEVSETGEDAETIDAQQQADNARADDKGLKYDSDGRYPANAAIQPEDPTDVAPSQQQQGAHA